MSIRTMEELEDLDAKLSRSHKETQQLVKAYDKVKAENPRLWRQWCQQNGYPLDHPAHYGLS